MTDPRHGKRADDLSLRGLLGRYVVRVLRPKHAIPSYTSCDSKAAAERIATRLRHAGCTVTITDAEGLC